MKIKNIIFSIAFMLFLINNMAIAQDKKKDNKPKKVRLKLEYLKLEDGTKVLSSVLYWKDGKDINPVIDQEVSFIAEDDSSELKLGTILSNKEGKAILHIEKDFKFPENKNGFTVFTAKMKKSDNYKRAKKSVEIKDADLDFSLDIIDSVKFVQVKVTTLDSVGQTIPIKSSEVYVYVKRLYSLYPVKKGYTNENGQFKVEFPTDMPGDSVGNLRIIVKVLDSDEYGTIEKAKEARWGTIVSFNDEDTPRALWGVEAPLWMIIAIFVVLAGAWFNFGLAIYKVNKMRKAN
ncbi:MAG: hypothetical protein ABFS35_00585 [Bacteroidota bacterium]